MKEGALSVWWIPQVPGKAFRAAVNNLREARLLINTLADYDTFQFEHRIKPDFCNAGGLTIWSLDTDGDGNPGWIDWHDTEGREFDEVPDRELGRVVWEAESERIEKAVAKRKKGGARGKRS